jgi:hypothetical protein
LTLGDKVPIKKVPVDKISAYDRFGTAIGIFVTGCLVYAAMRNAFLRKRELFLPGASDLDRKSEEDQKQHEGRNVYRDEDELFALLMVGKEKERPLDYLLVFLVIFFGGLFVSAFRLILSGTWSILFTVITFVAFVGVPRPFSTAPAEVLAVTAR